MPDRASRVSAVCLTSRSKLDRSTHAHVMGVIAMTLAARGMRVSSDFSPKYCPELMRPTSTASLDPLAVCVAFALPSMIRYIMSPSSPSLMIMAPGSK